MEHLQAAGKIFNVGRKIGTTLLEIINQINYLTDQNLQPIHKEVRPRDIHHSLADITAIKALRWCSSISIRQGLAKLLKTIPS